MEPIYVYKDNIPGNETLACFDQIKSIRLVRYKITAKYVMIVHNSCVWSFSSMLNTVHYDVTPFQFEMVPEDDPGNPIRASSSTACQTIVLKKINKARYDNY